MGQVGKNSFILNISQKYYEIYKELKKMFKSGDNLFRNKHRKAFK